MRSSKRHTTSNSGGSARSTSKGTSKPCANSSQTATHSSATPAPSASETEKKHLVLDGNPPNQALERLAHRKQALETKLKLLEGIKETPVLLYRRRHEARLRVLRRELVDTLAAIEWEKTKGDT